MANTRLLAEVPLALAFLLLAIVAVWRWNSFDCVYPFNYWILLFSLSIFLVRSTFILVIWKRHSFYIIATLAFFFLTFLCPFVVIWTIIGIAFYVLMKASGESCGTTIESWFILVLLIISLSHAVLAIIWSCNIYKSIRYYQVTLRNSFMNGLMMSQINDEVDLFSDEDLNMISSFTTRSSDLNLPCPICREVFLVEEILRALPRCGHIFHAACVDPWLTRNSPTCPVCRNNIRQSLTSLAS